MVHFREAYGTRAGLKSGGSLSTGISESLSTEGSDPERGGGRRRRETTGFCTTEPQSDMGSV